VSLVSNMESSKWKTRSFSSLFVTYLFFLQTVSKLNENIVSAHNTLDPTSGVVPTSDSYYRPRRLQSEAHHHHNRLHGVKLNIKMGYMTGSQRKKGDQEYSRPGLTISGGLTTALSDLKRHKFFGSTANVEFNLQVSETYGDEEVSLREVARLWKDHNISVIIGPQESCLHEARLAASLNIPMISYVSSNSSLFS